MQPRPTSPENDARDASQSPRLRSRESLHPRLPSSPYPIPDTLYPVFFSLASSPHRLPRSRQQQPSSPGRYVCPAARGRRDERDPGRGQTLDNVAAAYITGPGVTATIVSQEKPFTQQQPISCASARKNSASKPRDAASLRNSRPPPKLLDFAAARRRPSPRSHPPA